MANLMAPVAAPASPGRAAQVVSEADVLGALGGVNYNQVEGVVMRVLDPTLEYESVITKVTPTRAKDTKNPMIALELKVTYPPQFAGVKLWDNCTLTETALWKSKSLFEACAMLVDGKFTGRSLQDLVGFVVRHQVINEVFRGQNKNKIAGGFGEAWETPGLEKVPATVTTFAPDWAQPTG